MSEIENRTEEMVQPILDEFGFDLYDIEYVKEGSDYYLRVYIDKEGGITSDDTTDVCRALSDRIDEEKNFITEKYILEVSSPGITRALTKPKHFSSSIGKDVEFKLYKPVEYEEKGKKYTAKEFVGILKSYDEASDAVVIGIEDTELNLSRSDIASIRLWIDF
ncbi:MAG: ribosome maturation factor RimP [Eubacterium sp.]|nr:ribosome maturation factor RimP [Eubacterium sp.]